MKKENEFPLAVGSEVRGLGTITAIEQEIPGVCFLSIISDLDFTCEEYYAVHKSASAISKEAKTYGQRLADCPKVLFYQIYGNDSCWKIISYEIEKYRAKNLCSIPGSPSLLEIAWEGMEIHPEYFGCYPVPAATPWGYTVRHKSISNGVYWLETDQCRQAVAIYRGMCDDLSSAAKDLSVSVNGEPLWNMPDIWGYFFFRKEDSCIPVFEMLPLHPEWIDRGIIDRLALMNTIYQKYPQYALQNNLQEQLGQNDRLKKSLKNIGIEYTPHRSPKNMISLLDESGVEFYTFLR